MSLTPSTMLPLGTELPDLRLRNVHGTERRLRDLGDHGLLVLFLSNHCPYVVHVRPILRDLARSLASQGVATVGIHSNDVDAYPTDAPDRVKALAEELDWTFPQLVDADQQAAHAFTAACTPDTFLFDNNRRLVYRGQLDGSRPGRGTPTGEDVRAAVDRLLADEPPLDPQAPSTGCNIKWKPGTKIDTGWTFR